MGRASCLLGTGLIDLFCCLKAVLITLDTWLIINEKGLDCQLAVLPVL